MNLAPVQPKGTKFSFEQKEEAVRVWLTTGNMRIAAATVGCAVQTIESWKKQDWWNQLVSQIKTEKNLVLGSRMSSIVDKSMDLIEDRLVNGDFVLNNKTGEVVRKPVALRDLASTANVLMTRKSVMDSQDHQTIENKETAQEILSALAKEFAKIGLRASKQDAETIDYEETTDAIYEERSPRLQEGSSSLHE